MKDKKTDNIILGIRKVIEDLEGLIQDQKREQLQKQGIVGGLQAGQFRLAAELKKLGDDAKMLDKEDKLSEEEKNNIKGKLRGYTECIEILKAMEKENSADYQEMKGRIAGYADLVKRSEQKINEEKENCHARRRVYRRLLHTCTSRASPSGQGGDGLFQE